jgi:hypothetical protein
MAFKACAYVASISAAGRSRKYRGGYAGEIARVDEMPHSMR